MPKIGRDFETTLNFGVELELKQNLVAAGYLTAHKGEYASASRNFLWREFRRWLSTLSEQERRDFEEILKNVKLTITK